VEASGDGAGRHCPAECGEPARLRHAFPGMMRFMNWSNSGTMKAVSPCAGLQIIPLAMS